MKKSLHLILVLLSMCLFVSCGDDGSSTPAPAPAPKPDPQKVAHFSYILEQTADMIAVYGSKTVTKEQYDRVVKDAYYVIGALDSEIRKGLLASKAKLLVVKDEAEVTGDPYFMTLLPVEAIYVDNGGKDETLASSTDVGLSNTKLELMYLCVYYSLLTDPALSAKYDELKAAYKEAADAGLFTPGDAYKDGEIDPVHMNASKNNALKYGSYLYNLYKVYFGDQKGLAGEYKITTKAGMKAQNVKAHDFMSNYFAPIPSP